MNPLGQLPKSVSEWVTAVVLLAILAMAVIGYEDQRTTTQKNSQDIEDMKTKTIPSVVADYIKTDAAYNTRLTVLEDHYGTIVTILSDMNQQLRQLNGRRPRSYETPTSGHSSRPAPSKDDVLNDQQ